MLLVYILGGHNYGPSKFCINNIVPQILSGPKSQNLKQANIYSSF